TLPSGRLVGIVDVPGHARFIRNMLAGVHGLDAVLLVVAADEGVMPQTVEHLEIVDLLEIRRGLAVVTKVDLVEPDWLELVTAELSETLSRTSLRDVEILPVSAGAGRGGGGGGGAAGGCVGGTPPAGGSRGGAEEAAAADRPGVHDQRLRHRRHRHPGRRLAEGGGGGRASSFGPARPHPGTRAAQPARGPGRAGEPRGGQPGRCREGGAASWGGARPGRDADDDKAGGRIGEGGPRQPSASPSWGAGPAPYPHRRGQRPDDRAGRGPDRAGWQRLGAALPGPTGRGGGRRPVRAPTAGTLGHHRRRRVRGRESAPAPPARRARMGVARAARRR